MQEKILIYVAHPYGGKDENKKKVEEFIKKFSHIDNAVFISPIHTFGWLYEDVDYLKGIDICLALLNQCDVLVIPRFDWVQHSKGCLMELGFAKAKETMDVVYWDELENYLQGYGWEEV